MRREAGDHRGTEPLDVVGELAQIATGDAGIDQDQPRDPAHHGRVAPDPLALPDPDAVSHLSQHRLNLSGDSTQREWPRAPRPIRPAASPKAHAHADDGRVSWRGPVKRLAPFRTALGNEGPWPLCPWSAHDEVVPQSSEV